jgi:hypothetical protein
VRVGGGPTDGPDLPSRKPLESMRALFLLPSRLHFCNLFVSHFVSFHFINLALIGPCQLHKYGIGHYRQCIGRSALPFTCKGRFRLRWRFSREGSNMIGYEMGFSPARGLYYGQDFLSGELQAWMGKKTRLLTWQHFFAGVRLSFLGNLNP